MVSLQRDNQPNGAMLGFGPPHAALLPLPPHARAAGGTSMSASGGDAPADCQGAGFHAVSLQLFNGELRLRPHFKLSIPNLMRAGMLRPLCCP